MEEGRRSHGNHGYQTRAAVEETSRHSAEIADDDDNNSISEVRSVVVNLEVCCIEHRGLFK